MNPIFLATITGVLLAAPLCAQAQPSAPPRGPSDPGAPAPALGYDSALRGHVRFGADATVTPDKHWRRANDTVAGNAGGDRQPEHGEAGAAAPAHGHHHSDPSKQ